MSALLCAEHDLPARYVVVHRALLPACAEECFDRLWLASVAESPDVYALDVATAEAISGLHVGAGAA